MLFHASIHRCQEFHKLSTLVIDRTLNPIISGEVELGKGVFWSYFSKDYQRKDDFVYPSLLGRIRWIIGGLVSALLRTIFNLMSNIFMFRSPPTWGQWGKQLGICLARDGLEILSYPVAIFDYQYARYLVDCHQLQKFCLIRTKDQKGKSIFLGNLIKKLINDNNDHKGAIVNSISYVDLVGAVRAPGLLQPIHLNPVVQQKFVDWVEDKTWIETTSDQELEVKLSALRDSLKCIKDEKKCDQQIINALVYLERERRSAAWMASLALLLTDIKTKKDWCEKVNCLDLKDWKNSDSAAFEIIKKKANSFILANDLMQGFEENQNDPVLSQEYIDECIEKKENIDSIVEFGDCLAEKYREDKVENLLCLKYAYKIFLHHDYGGIIENKERSFTFKDAEMITPIAEEIKKDPKSDWKDLLKLEYQLHHKEAFYLLYKIIGKDLLGLSNNKLNLTQTFELLDDIDLSRENFQSFLEDDLFFNEKALAKILPLQWFTFESLLPKNEEDVKKMVEINPKFLRYCHPEIFKDKKLMLEIAIQNICALPLADVPLDTIAPLNKQVLRNFRYFFICNKIKNNAFPKPIAYKIFAHVLTLNANKANSLAGKLMAAKDK